MNNGWIGVGLDGILSHYDGWAEGEIGEPIPAMLTRVKTWLFEGRDIRIVTSRVSSLVPAKERSAQRNLIQRWCIKHLGEQLPMTAELDTRLVALYSNRCVQVETNTGRVVEDVQHEGVHRHSCDCPYCPHVPPVAKTKTKKSK